MTRPVLAAALLALLASGARAKDLCIQLDSGLPGSIVVLRDVKLGAGAFGPVHGYLARSDLGVIVDFAPLDGEALVSSQRNLVLGLSWHETALLPNGEVNPLNDLIAVNVGCESGLNGKIDLTDACHGFVDDGFGNFQFDAHVITCTDAPKLP